MDDKLRFQQLALEEKQDEIQRVRGKLSLEKFQFKSSYLFIF